ncbi:class I SAM-dependent methyltransferase [Mucilaginibacter pallidiroseus]|uniref:Class I SAM-dependent methyltransferase n=1 Tax=Mucilaginibacter pallidiroseus TaxID=2599295 RepID=A0A563UF62_9SPHI|nr:class I SAM-dependent methyltransferase [Mucilaginibacter pallidiroseus]TWR30004.1 class I SAM-dependent methyltransferase [Mucilaginibacter pallidiroseus]
MKDNFSQKADEYAKYRPTYPPELFDYLDTLVTNKVNAWDCGTGNGQVARQLAKSFVTVYATDISKTQLENAHKAENIIYTVQPAEQTNFPDGLFDLIVVAQAIHWFDFDRFYNEVKRTAKKDAIICVLGYGMLQISEQIDEVISNFYKNVIGPYWDDERKYVDEGYKTIPFPFEEIQTPAFTNTKDWELDHLVGYLNTWSAVKHFINQNGYNPIDELRVQIEPHWAAEEIKPVSFPLLLRIGKI